MSSLRPGTVIAATIGIGVLGFLGYAVYFDHRRRNDVEFRKALKRDYRRDARIARSQVQDEAVVRLQPIRKAVDTAKAEGFPDDVHERENYFMEQISRGEVVSQQPDSEIDAALCFYKALKVYPTPSDLINIYDQTVPKPVLDVLAEMISYDSSLNVRGFSAGSRSSNSSIGSHHGVDD